MIARCLLIFAVLLSAFSADAYAQVIPSGEFTPGHTVSCANSTCTVITDGGGAGGSFLPGQGYLTELGITALGLPECINDALTGAAGGYHQLCFGANATVGGSTGGFITYNAYGGASPLPLYLNLNGTNYALPVPNGPIAGVSVLGNATSSTAVQMALPFADVTGVVSTLGSLNVSASNQTTTGTIISGTANLALTSALDFVNGEGILIEHAGASFTASAPSSCSVTAHGGSGTSYTYKMSSIDANGGVGAEVTATVSGGATLSATVYNAISCTPGSGVGMAIWGGKTSGSQPLLAVVPAGTFNDIGAGSQVNLPLAPYWLPASAPTSALADRLVTTVKQGGGSINLVLNNTASNNATGVNIIHDDTAAVQAGINTAISGGLGFFFAAGTYHISSPLTWCSSSCTTPMNISGAGMYNVTIAVASPTQDAIQNNSTIGSTLHDIGFLGGGAANGTGPFQIGGAFINVVNVHLGSDTIYNVLVSNGYNAITDNTAPFVYSNIVGDFANAGGNFPTNVGDSTWTQSYLNPQSIPGAMNASCVISSSGDPGGFRFINNKCIGPMSDGLVFAPSVQDGDIYVADNSFECLNAATSYAACSAGIAFNYNGVLFGGVAINGPGDIVGFTNGVASTSRAVWLSDVNIGHGIEIANATNGISAGGMGNLNVNGAIFETDTIAIDVDANATGCVVGVNTYSNISGAIIDDASNTCGMTALGNWSFPGSGSQITLGANGGQGGNIKFNGSTSGNVQIGAASNGQLTVTSIVNAATADALCYNTSTDVITYNATDCTVSAKRFKNPVSVIDPDTAYIELHHLRAVSFTYKPGDHYMPGEHVGFFADDVCAVDERLCIRDAEGNVQNYDERGLIAWQYAASQASLFTRIAVWLDLE